MRQRVAVVLSFVCLLSVSPLHAQEGATDEPASSTGAESGFVIQGGFEGISRRGEANPPDPTIGAGPQSLFLVTNQDVALYDKRGNRLASKLMTLFFDSVRAGEGLADPRAVFDAASNRFVMVAIGRPPQFQPPCITEPCISHTFVAVSKTATPTTLETADWYFYASDSGLDHTPAGPVRSQVKADRPQLGLNDHWVAVEMAADPWDETSAYERLRIFDKNQLVGGHGDQWTDFLDIGIPDGSAPVVNLDPGAPLFVVGNTCGLRVVGVDGDVSAPDVTVRDVPDTAPADRNRCRSSRQLATQPGSSARLDAGVTGLLWQTSAVYRGGFIWIVHTVPANSGESAIRLAQIDVRTWPDAVRLADSALLTADGASLFYPAMRVDTAGNVCVVANRGGPDEFPSVVLTGRLSTDPPGTLRPAVSLKNGESPLEIDAGENPVESGANRYGDYAGVDIDPTDGSCWGFSEFAKRPDTWSTWVAHIALNNSQ